MTEEIKKKIESCRTANQVRKILDKNHIRIIRDNTEEMGAFSVWIDETTRIYKPYRSKTMKVQTWTRQETIKYSGIPTFFSTGLFREVIG